MIDEEIYRAAIRTFGAEAQKVVAIEECAELAQAITHEIRGREHNVPEEIADVEICIAQMKMIYGCTDEVERIKKQKIERLYDRICEKCF